MTSSPPPLTPRQQEIVGLVVRGYSAKEIARSLIVSQHTVRTHLKHVFRKWGVHNKAQLTALWCSQWGGQATSHTEGERRTAAWRIVRILVPAASVYAVLVTIVVLALSAASGQGTARVTTDAVEMHLEKTLSSDGVVQPGTTCEPLTACTTAVKP